MSGFGGTIYPQLFDTPGQGPTIGPATPQPTTPDALNAARAALFLHAIQAGGAPSTDPRSLFNGPNQYRDPRLTLPGAQSPDAGAHVDPLRPSTGHPVTDEIDNALFRNPIAQLMGISGPPSATNPLDETLTPMQRAMKAAPLLPWGEIARPLADEFRLSGLAGKAAKAIDDGGHFDVATGDPVKGNFTPDPLYTRTILPHENPRAVIKSFLKDPQVQSRMEQTGAHLGVRTNTDGLGEVHLATPAEEAPAPRPAPSYRVEDEGPKEHLANAQSIVSMHQQMYGPDVHLDPADLRAVAERARKAGIDLHVTPRSSASDIMAQLQGREPNVLPRRATSPIPTGKRSFQDLLQLHPGTPEELGASPGFGYEGPQPEGGPQLPVRGLLPRQPTAPLALPPGAPAAESRVVAQGLTREAAVAQMKELGQQGVRAQMQPMKDGTFNIVRKGEAGTAVAPAQAHPTTLTTYGTQGDPYESGFQSRTSTALANNPKYAKLKLTPQQWYSTLSHDPNIPRDELNALHLDPEKNIQEWAGRKLQEWKANNERTFADRTWALNDSVNGITNLDWMDRAIADYSDDNPTPESEQAHNAVAQFHQTMKSAFPAIDPSHAVPIQPLTPEMLAETFDPAMAKLQKELEGTDAWQNLDDNAHLVAWRYESARGSYEQARIARENLNNPPDYARTIRQSGDSAPAMAKRRLENRMDEHGRIDAAGMQDYVRDHGPVERLDTQTLEAEGGGEPEEPDEDALHDRASDLRDSWRDEQGEEAHRLLNQRDKWLHDAHLALKDVLGEQEAKSAHEHLVSKHFTDKDELLEAYDIGEYDHMVPDELRDDVAALQPDEDQSEMFEPNSDLKPFDEEALRDLQYQYNRAAEYDRDAFEALQDYHDPDGRGPDFYDAAREEYEHGGQTQRDPGDTEYSSYQRVDEDAPYREILIRNPDLENAAPGHWKDYPGTIAHARGELHDGGQNYLMIEAQSDMAQRAQHGNDAELTNQLKPFDTTERWAQLATGASLRQAAKEGSNSFSWVTPENRWTAADLAPEAGNITYGHAVPKAIDRIYKHLDEPVERIDDPGHGMPTIKLSPEMRKKILKAGIPALGLVPAIVRKKDGTSE